jgi:para-nitrobenzyl esterase
MEVAYVFRSLDFESYPVDQALSDAMQGYWTRFARTGDPNGEGELSWSQYDDASDERMNSDADLSVISGFRRLECEFWWGVYDNEFE